MPTHIALLRGINLGGRNKVAMADLREVIASLGHTDVATYIQSGNVVFSAGPPGAGSGENDQVGTGALAETMEQAISSALGVAPRVVVLSHEELAQAVRDNPYAAESNPRAVHAVFLSGQPGPEVAARVADAVRQVSERGSGDTAQVIGRTIFLHTPDGFGRSDLGALLTKPKPPGSQDLTGTARNWATVTKLLAMCGA
jgi:uncharacterized protein (DUF1697 family)